MIFKRFSLKNIVFFFFIAFVSGNSYSQSDTSKTNLSFDFGITRGRNINLWPIFKKFKSAEKNELQIIYPIFSKTTNYNLHSKHLQFLPFVINDSSTKGVDRRFISLYYPSVIRIQKQNTSTTRFNSIKFLELAPNISCLNITRSPGGMFVENNLFFFILYKKDMIVSKTHLVIFPAYWYFSNRNDTTRLLFPLYYKKTGIDDKKLDIAFIYYYRKSLTEQRNVLFPIWWNNVSFNYNDTIKKNVLFPIYWSTKSKSKNNKVFFPLVYNFKNRGYHSFTFLPFFSFGQSTDSCKKHLAVTPLFWHLENVNSKKDILFPIIWRTEKYYNNDTIRKSTLFPIYWSIESKNKNTHVIFPMLYNINDQNYHSYTILPFFSFGQSSDLNSKYLAVTPLYWHLEQRTSKNDILFPVFWKSVNYFSDDTIKKTTLFPFYWSEESKKKHNMIFFPVLYSFKNKENNSFTFLPFFSYGQSSDSSNNYLAVTPLYWHLEEPNSKKDILFPIIWRTEKYMKDDTIKRSTVFPFYWSTESKEKNNKALFPFIFVFKNQNYNSFTFLPLFSVGHSADSTERYIELFQIYWNFKTKNRQDNVVFPLWWSTKRFYSNDTISRKMLFPIYWSEKSNTKKYDVLFPLYYKIKNQYIRSLTIFPVFSYGQTTDSSNKYFAITPFYWHFNRTNSRKDILFPIFWRTEKYYNNDTIKKNTLFPIYWSIKSKEKSYKVLFPLLYSFTNQHYHSFTFFPVFSFGHKTNSGNNYLAITPLYWHLEEPNSNKDILFPIFWRTEKYYNNDTIKKNVLFPIYWSVKSKEKSYKVLFPLYYSFTNQHYHSFTFFPVFSFGHKTNSGNNYLALTPLYWHFEEPNSKKDILFPVFWRTEKYYNNDTIKKNTLFPIYWSIKNKDKNNKVLFPLVYGFKNQYYHSFTFFPVFSSGRTPDSKNNYLVITPLFLHLNQRKGRTDILFPVFWRTERYLYKDTLIKNTLFPIYWTVKRNDKNNKVLFPFVVSLKNRNYQSFTLFPLFSIGHKSGNDEKYLMITPLAGIFQTPVKKRLFLFPLFNYKKELDETQSSVLLFVFRKTEKPNYSKTDILWPICERLKFENYNYFRFAPFIWYLKTDTSKMFSLQPLFYSYNSSSKRTFIFNWFLYKYENKKGYSVSNSIMWKLFYKERFLNGDFETRFLYLIYANVDKQGQKEKIIFPFYHYEKNPNGDFSKSVCIGFYNYFKRYIPEINEFYEEERIFWFVRIRSNYAKLKKEGKGKYLKRK